MTKIAELAPILEGVSLQLTPPPKTEYDFGRILTTTPTHPATSALFRKYTLLLSYLLASFPTPLDNNDNNNIPTLTTLASKSHPHYTAELDVQVLQIEKRFDQLSELIPASISLHDELFNTQGEKLVVGVHYNNDHREQDFLDRAKRLSKEILNLERIIEELLTLDRGTLEIATGEVEFVPDILVWRLTSKTEVPHDKMRGDARKLRKEVPTTEAAAADCKGVVRVNTLFSSTDRPYNQSFTGWLIDNKTVVTTGAAVYNHSHGFASAVNVVVVNNKETYHGTHCGVHWAFFIGADRSFSLGVIRLDREIGDNPTPLKPRNPPFQGENITVTIRGGYNRKDQRVNKALTFDRFSNRPAAFKVALDFVEDPLGCVDKIAELKVRPVRTEEMRSGLCRI
ncbi:hypothetical protein QBC40DRAFT_270080 [Triangularia verruculosa]|uniref:Uncharacterized protein n=1 Tax=Triangularia verruculosa TaxID=2587418 RepID=A0AAN6X5J0_9PEZI|nr:hypothetical protein QBC40DRAFT_270080 [Triangularia verruculosa]